MTLKAASLTLAMAAALSANQALAGGFEKNILWSGRYAGQAGAAVSSVTGSEALYFNPAALARGEGQHVSVNFSPTISQYEGPVTTAGSEIEAEQGFSPVFGITYKYTLNEKLAIGAGYYVAGGTNVEYKDVTVGPVQTDFQSAITLTEFALGAGYKINDQWHVGLAWRASFVDATIKSASASGGGVSEAENESLKATSLTGFRLGVLYTPNETWSIGLNYRSAVDFTAEGDTTLRLNGSTLGSGDVEVESVFPHQVALGGNYMFSETWTGFFEYVWTNYAAVDKIEFDRSGGLPDNTVDSEWEDQHNIRLAAEYRGLAVPLRFGYVYTTAAVPEANANPTFSTPGPGHTLTFGSSYGLMEDKLMLNGAFEYSFASQSVNKNQTTNNPGQDGDYSSSGYSLHLGVAYAF